MNYTISNDKRKTLNNILFLFCCLIYAILEIFVLSKVVISNETWKTIWIIIQCVLGLSPVLFYTIFKWALNRLFMLLCGIKNLTGTYEGTLKSVWKNKITDIPVAIEIKHTLEKLNIKLVTEQSHSYAKNIGISTVNNIVEITYNYENLGNPIDKNNKMHMGTCMLTIDQDNITGFYFNNGRDRESYGDIQAKKTPN